MEILPNFLGGKTRILSMKNQIRVCRFGLQNRNEINTNRLGKIFDLLVKKKKIYIYENQLKITLKKK